MSSYDNVVRGKRGFSYEVKVLDDERSITAIRDPQDELFAQIEYTPQTGEYIIEIDGGYSTRQDLKELGFVDGMNIHEGEAPEFENMIGSFENEVIDNWREMTYASLQKNGRTLEIENVDDDNRKTLVRLISGDSDMSSSAEKLANMIRPPFIEGEPGDPYNESWAPYSNSDVLRRNSKDREQTIEEVFDTAITLTEDILEKKQRSRD